MKLRRSERMVVISNYLINHPYELTSLNTFAEKYESAKSSISEDIVIIKRAFEEMEIGHIETITGAGGGVIFTPSISDKEARAMVEDLRTKLSESNRILPGGYIYLSDLLSTPSILNNIGRIIAKTFRNQKIDAVMTVATKGVPLANAVANKVLMLENAMYSILSPEGFATILWKDGSRADEAASVMKCTSHKLLELGIIDGIIEEEQQASLENVDIIAEEIKKEILKFADEYKDKNPEYIRNQRYERFRQM